MFEVNPACEVTAIVDIGPDNRSAMVIDNFYENPHEVRKLALDLPRSKNIHFTNHHSGLRSALDTLEVRKNISRILFELLSDGDHWGRETDMEFIEKNMEYMWFLVDYINEKSIDEEPLRLLPFQCYYEHNPSPFQFTVDIFLNEEKECFGGINIWNFAGRTSIVEDIKNMYADKDKGKFDIMKDVYDSKFTWSREMTFGMKFNRAVIIPADILISPILNTGKFADVDRMVQKLFL
jgi:hypothetical protein|tara:strand:- start:49 stop:756 length:708 start_codon:yes stop_codon:yes gene_type:complete